VVGCLQVQPVVTIGLPVDVQSEVGREQVPILRDAAPATVDPLRERLFLAAPAQTGLRQGSRIGVELVETFPAGAFNLAAHHRYEQSRSRTLRGKFFCHET
jgi:hypothetical protein